MHNDKHTVKMIIEYAQLMSTAHRLLDGVPYLDKTANGRSIKRWRLEGENETVMMKASHINHPSAVWTRSNRQNYNWLYCMWYYLCKEYTYRYDKIHAVEKRMSNALYLPPINIVSSEFFPQRKQLGVELAATIMISLCCSPFYRNFNCRNISISTIRGH